MVRNDTLTAKGFKAKVAGMASSYGRRQQQRQTQSEEDGTGGEVIREDGWPEVL